MVTVVDLLVLTAVVLAFGFLAGYEAGLLRGRELAAKDRDEHPHD